MRFFKRIIHEENGGTSFGGFFTTTNFFLIFFAAAMAAKWFPRIVEDTKIEKEKSSLLKVKAA